MQLGEVADFEALNFLLALNLIWKLNFNLALNPQFCQTAVVWCHNYLVLFIFQFSIFTFQFSLSVFQLSVSTFQYWIFTFQPSILTFQYAVSSFQSSISTFQSLISTFQSVTSWIDIVVFYYIFLNTSLLICLYCGLLAPNTDFT